MYRIPKPDQLMMRLTAMIRRMSRGQKLALAAAFAGILLLSGVLWYGNSRSQDGGDSGGDAGGSSDVQTEDRPLSNRFAPQPSYSRAYFVSPGGLDSNDGTTADKPMLTIDKALSFAEGGDTINLADGDYYQTVVTVKDGRPEAPIRVTGSRDAVVRGSSGFNRVMEVRHSHLTLEGFTIDGQNGEGKSAGDFRDKLLFVVGSKPKQGVEGLKVRKMLIQNAGGECVRLRYFAKYNEIADSEIKHCGIHDFRFDGGAKNGEGIYIGTAPEQLGNGVNPTDDPDVSTMNIIRNNRIETHGNECVDIKEASVNNIVEGNFCQYQMDSESAGFDARGNDNTFRYNTSQNNVGAGFRLGGDEDRDGINNHVYNNRIVNNKGGVVKVVREPQGKICGNELSGNADKQKPDGVDKACEG